MKVDIDFVDKVVHIVEQKMFHELADLSRLARQKECEKQFGQFRVVGQEERFDFLNNKYRISKSNISQRSVRLTTYKSDAFSTFGSNDLSIFSKSTNLLVSPEAANAASTRSI